MKDKNLYKSFVLYRKVETNIKGCPEDESESEETKTELFVIPDDEEEKFCESMADDYGYQDYSYRVGYQRLVKLQGSELQELANKVKLL